MSKYHIYTAGLEDIAGDESTDPQGLHQMLLSLLHGISQEVRIDYKQADPPVEISDTHTRINEGEVRVSLDDEAILAIIDRVKMQLTQPELEQLMFITREYVTRVKGEFPIGRMTVEELRAHMSDATSYVILRVSLLIGMHIELLLSNTSID